jgi:heme/copper-type cytochrome/quinol oxidase subunit 3
MKTEVFIFAAMFVAFMTVPACVIANDFGKAEARKQEDLKVIQACVNEGTIVLEKITITCQVKAKEDTK